MAADEAPVAGSSGSSGVDVGMLLAAEVRGDGTRSRRFGFRIGSIGFLVPIGVTSEVIHHAGIYPLPWQVPCMRGLVNVRGNVVPVFDLTSLMDASAKLETPYTLVIDSGYRAVGLMTATLPMTLTCEKDEESASTALPAALAPFIRGASIANQSRWFELDHLACLRAVAAGQILLDRDQPSR